MQCKVFLIYSMCVYRTMVFRISIQDGTKLSYQQKKPTEMVLEGLYKSKLQDSDQLQTTVAGMNKKLFETTNSRTIPD